MNGNWLDYDYCASISIDWRPCPVPWEPFRHFPDWVLAALGVPKQHKRGKAQIYLLALGNPILPNKQAIKSDQEIEKSAESIPIPSSYFSRLMLSSHEGGEIHSLFFTHRYRSSRDCRWGGLGPWYHFVWDRKMQ